MSRVNFDIELYAYSNRGYSPETEVEHELTDDQVTHAVEQLCERYSDALAEIAQAIAENDGAEARAERAIDAAEDEAYWGYNT